MIRIELHPKRDQRIKAGHPWIFSNEIARAKGDPSPGVTAEVFDSGGSFLGIGYYNPHSLIAVRLLTRVREDIDSSSFYTERLRKAVAYRNEHYPGLTSFRAVHGEGDFLPGLVVDKYGDYLSIQLLSCGMETRRNALLAALRETFNPKGILARNDVAVRKLEGLEERIELLYGDIPEELEIEENGLRFAVSLMTGQKTGHFLDQKENHLLLKGHVEGKRVLDCFCYSGSWGVHAAHFGACDVTCLDISDRAIALARKNADINGLSERMRFETIDVFERLRTMKSEGQRFDLIVMDPPAFVKSRKTVKEAQKGYLTINRRALELLNPGGILVTCSCSYHMEREMFRELIDTTARLSCRQLRLLASRSQALDHPVLLNVPETEYLKCLMVQAV
jgi:23S rRNA (cytosine1962-C5)-methyltransferase